MSREEAGKTGKEATRTWELLTGRTGEDQGRTGRKRDATKEE